MSAKYEGSELFRRIDLEGDFPDVDDAEGYIEQVNYYDRSKVERKYFYRVGNTMSDTFVACADVDCDGAYFIRDLLELAYRVRKTHVEGDIPCRPCADDHRKGKWCRAKFSMDIKYKMPEQQPVEGTTIQSPDDRLDLY
jgi:hypothetical protein